MARSMSNGWTVISPSSDSRMVYVSPTGSDANSGLTAGSPKRTIAAGKGLIRDGFPDWLQLQTGGVWHEAIGSWKTRGRSTAEPQVICAYGGLERARLLTGVEDGFTIGNFSGPSLGHVCLFDMDITPDQYVGSGPAPNCIHVLANEAGVTDLLVENCYCSRSAGGIVFDSNEGGISNVQIRRSLSVDNFRTGDEAHVQGLYIAGTNGVLLEDLVLDSNGVQMGDIFRHNIYIQGHDGGSNDCSNVTTRGILSARAGATGMQQRPGGLCEDCLFIQNPVNLVFGTLGGIVNNVVCYDSRDINAANPRGVGINCVNASAGATTTLNDCLCMIRSITGTANIGAYCPDKLVNPLRMTRCIAWGWKSPNGVGVALDVRESPQPILTQCNLQGMPGAHDPLQVRTLGTYLTSLGIAPGPDQVATFMAEARKQSRANWRAEFTPKVVNAYLWGAWEATQVLWADKNHNGVLDEGDFGAFLALYAADSPEADANGDGRLNVADFTAFLQRYAAEKAGQVGGG